MKYLISIVLSFINVSIWYFHYLWSEYPTRINIVWLLLDYLFFTISFNFLVLKSMYLFGCCITWSSFLILYFNHLVELFGLLRKNVELLIIRKVCAVQRSKYKKMLNLVPKKHLYICWLLLIHSRAGGILSLVVFFSAIPMQIYLIYRIMFHRLNFGPLLCCSMLVACISFDLFIIFLSIAHFTLLCHRPIKCINRIQISLKHFSVFRQKLLYFYLYERLSLSTYSISFGFHSPITYGFLAKVSSGLINLI